MTRYLVGFIFVLALGVMGCSETSGTGGSGGAAGDGGTGGMGGSGGTDLCEGIDCDDGNECTEDACAGGTCSNTAVEDDTACGDGAGTCQEGSCAGTFACTEQGVRDAIAIGGGPHTFTCDGPTTVVTEAAIEIDNNIILDGEGNLTVDGDDDHPVFGVAFDVTAELHGVAVIRGRAEGVGGGIDNAGTLTLTNSTVSGNEAVRVGSSTTVPGWGGGVVNTGTLTLTNSTVSGNSAQAGGGIFNAFGTVTLTNSTVSGNIAAVLGGGIVNFRTLTLMNSTVSGNIAADGGGIVNYETLTLTNSVIDGDCSPSGTVSNGYNIESPGDTCGFDQGTDQVNVSAEELALGPLQDNSGPTMTHGLGVDSVAIDHIPETDCALATDQRGETRPAGPLPQRCDVGAFEVQP